MVRRICKVGKGAQVENLLFYWFFCASVDVGRFLYLNKYASGLGSTNLCEGFFGLIFPTKRIFEPTVLLLKKAARCQPFLAVVRCLFHNHLRLKRSSLLNVYLNYKFEISLLTSHLFFSLFTKIVRRHISRKRSGVASQQRFRPKIVDSTLKRVPKLRFEPVSFLFLVCL